MVALTGLGNESSHCTVGLSSQRGKMKSRAVQLLALVFFWSGLLPALDRLASILQPAGGGEQALRFAFLKRRTCRPVQILTYHRVNDDRDPFFPGTPTKTFSAQMGYLADRCHVYSLTEAAQRLASNDVPENAVVVTFDDGYRDNYTHAFPILKERGIPATVFLATGVIGNGQVLWHDRVFSAFRETRQPALSEYHPDVPFHTLCTIEDKLIVQHAVLRVLRLMNEEDRSSWIARLAERLAVDERAQDLELMLNWEHVKEMRRAGVSFGSHTVSHPILSRLSRDQMRVQIVDSCTDIHRHLGERPQVFAYPNGGKDDFNEVTKDLLQEAGYICAVTTIFGANSHGQDPFELRRGQPWEEHLPTFATKLSWYRFVSTSA